MISPEHMQHEHPVDEVVAKCERERPPITVAPALLVEAQLVVKYRTLVHLIELKRSRLKNTSF